MRAPGTSGFPGRRRGAGERGAGGTGGDWAWQEVRAEGSRGVQGVRGDEGHGMLWDAE